MSDEPPRVPIEEQLEAARRELRMRMRVYPRRVADKKMTQKQADHETRCMSAIVDTLEKVASEERLI